MLDTVLLRRSFVALSLLACAVAQGPSTGGWLEPSSIIKNLVTAPAAPSPALTPQGNLLVMTTRESLPDLAVVARPHLKLAGMRIDGSTWSRQLSTKTVAMTVQKLRDDSVHTVSIEPDHWSGPIWSSDERAFALIRNTDGGGELWLADPYTAVPRRVDGVRLNQVLGGAVQWMPDQKSLLVRAVVGGPRPAKGRVPKGPVVQQTQSGLVAQVRTYQDLLQNTHDEDLLEYYSTSQLAVVDAASLRVKPLGKPAMYSRVSPSPDGTLLLVDVVQKPFSYVVPLSRFPRTTTILDMAGVAQRELAKDRLLDAIPIGGVKKGPRRISWLATAQHALYWTEAQDDGNPKNKVPHRDFVFMLPEPNGNARLWYKTEFRAGGVQFSGDGQLVLAGEVDRKTRTERIWRYDMSKLGQSGELVYERSTQDVYGDPGRTVSERTRDGRSVLRAREGRLFLSGRGASPKGSRPFLDSWAVKTGEKQRVFESAEGRHETFMGFVGSGTNEFLVHSESKTEAPALLYINTDTGKRRVLHSFADPAAKWTKLIKKRLVRYEREDGVPMNGTLYLPPNYKEGDKLPCLVWAYPREYVKASDAGQVRATPNRYLRLRGSSHLFMLLNGYAVFDNASMPIVGPRRTANDTFIDQVRMNGEAAVKALTAEGCIDPKRVAVAGHSYGAFMTANLLAHSDMFCCGIARSGAYNRTLTPFGFQNEERTYWEAPEIYFAMSPFMHVPKINEPLLLIHGQDDNNSGTFPIQSQRLFVALKGHGANARLCFLPFESHGYRGRQSVLHCLAEMSNWLDQHCKGAGK
ncbi:MAG: dipeptidyl aminopeptidase/acylaminoacyl peptidase [Planctomycetota bacterium]|jgi:dipeptidyl aminopeptidase/acylaminoacyl peptidase